MSIVIAVIVLIVGVILALKLNFPMSGPLKDEYEEFLRAYEKKVTKPKDTTKYTPEVLKTIEETYMQLIETLGVYSKEENWKDNELLFEGEPPLQIRDKGELARNTLKEINEKLAKLA
jgi:hypothetical protein